MWRVCARAPDATVRCRSCVCVIELALERKPGPRAGAEYGIYGKP